MITSNPNSPRGGTSHTHPHHHSPSASTTTNTTSNRPPPSSSWIRIEEDGWVPVELVVPTGVPSNPFAIVRTLTSVTLKPLYNLSLIHISEPTRLLSISYAVFCLKKKTKQDNCKQYLHTT
eukprot:TRINITY_DN15332_c0_g1_i4.p1 TRINITY_DN15332_c0_g1~~TRINITY_DN15332_c0_g1_i4.p1  ORF type:complete len:121 (+),score=19.00 TRINITY_DN15332_c0_g1_i4:252-614(+)